MKTKTTREQLQHQAYFHIVKAHQANVEAHKLSKQADIAYKKEKGTLWRLKQEAYNKIEYLKERLEYGDNSWHYEHRAIQEWYKEAQKSIGEDLKEERNEWYEVKENAIKQAVACIKKVGLDECVIKVSTSRDFLYTKENEYGSTDKYRSVYYFETPHGTASFHKRVPLRSITTEGKWSGDIGETERTCFALYEVIKGLDIPDINTLNNLLKLKNETEALNKEIEALNIKEQEAYKQREIERQQKLKQQK